MARLGRSFPALLKRGTAAVLLGSTTLVTVSASAGATVNRSASATLSVAVNPVFPFSFPLAFWQTTTLGQINGFQASTTISATPTAGITSAGVAGSLLDVVATCTANLSATSRGGAALTALATTAAGGTNNANAQASLTPILSTANFASNNAFGSASSTVTASASAAGVESAFAQSSLSITATTSGTAYETDRGEATLPVTATTTAAGSVNYPVGSVSTTVSVSQSADSQRIANAAASYIAGLASSTVFPFTFPVLLGYQMTDSLRNAAAAASLSAQIVTQQLTIAQSFSASLSVVATGIGTGYSYKRGDFSTSVSATTAADAFNTAKVQSNLGVTATTSSSIFKDAGVTALATINCSSSADMRSDGVVGSSLNVTTGTNVVGVENGYGTSVSSFTVTPTADSYRVAPAAALSSASAQTSGGADRNALAPSQSLGITATPSASAANPVSLSTLSDYFNGTTVSSSTWTGSRNVTVSSGQISMVPAASTDSYPYVQAYGYDFEDGAVVSVQLVQAATGLTTNTVLAIQDQAGTGSLIQAWVNDGNWYFRVRYSDSTFSATGTLVYSSDANDWVRVSRSSGSIVFETAPDGISWTTRHTVSLDSDTAFQLHYASGTLRSLYFGIEASPGLAIWDNFNIVPVTASSTLTCNVSSSVNSVRGQYGTAQLSVLVGATGAGRCDAKAQSYLFSAADTYAGMLKTLNGSATLSVAAEGSGAGFENDVASSILDISATSNAALSRGQNISARTDVSTAATADPSLVQFLSAVTTDVLFSPSASALNNASARAALGITVQSDAGGRRTQYADALLSITASTSLQSFIQEYAQAVTTSIVTAAAANMAANKPLIASLPVTAITYSTAAVRLGIQGSLSVRVEASFEVTEPREIVYVEADIRSVAVAAEVRGSSVSFDDRHISVSSESRGSAVSAEDRSSSVSIDVRKVYVSAEERHLEVPAENLKATV
jgi:hypothetical protein